MYRVVLRFIAHLLPYVKCGIVPIKHWVTFHSSLDGLLWPYCWHMKLFQSLVKLKFPGKFNAFWMLAEQLLDEIDCILSVVMKLVKRIDWATYWMFAYAHRLKSFSWWIIQHILAFLDYWFCFCLLCRLRWFFIYLPLSVGFVQSFYQLLRWDCVLAYVRELCKPKVTCTFNSRLVLDKKWLRLQKLYELDLGSLLNDSMPVGRPHTLFQSIRRLCWLFLLRFL